MQASKVTVRHDPLTVAPAEEGSPSTRTRVALVRPPMPPPHPVKLPRPAPDNDPFYVDLGVPELPKVGESSRVTVEDGENEKAAAK